MKTDSFRQGTILVFEKKSQRISKSCIAHQQNWAGSPIVETELVLDRFTGLLRRQFVEYECPFLKTGMASISSATQF